MANHHVSVPDDLHLVEHLHQKLKAADKVCYVCGNLFGSIDHNRMSTFHHSDCDVCGRVEVPVTEVRDYQYLTRGIMHLEQRLEEDYGVVFEKPERAGNSKPLMKRFLKTCDKAGTPVEHYESQ